jgi:predicted RNA-binding Zn-ribbon protein involved in translation (DUF1610 family)
MMASPSDVEHEREIIGSVLEDWNIVHSERERLVLLPVSSHTHAVPAVGDRPQAFINTDVLSTCDLLVAVFWTRVGTPTGAAISGTVEEIETHVQAGRPAMVYFSKRPVSLDRVDTKQYEKLKTFLKRFQKNALVDTFEDEHKFRERFGRALPQVINRHFTGAPAALPADPEREKYRQVTTRGGAEVWQYIPDDASQAARYACPNCWSVEILRLNRLGTLGGKYQCPRCQRMYPINPPQDIPYPDQQYARRSTNAWGDP